MKRRQILVEHIRGNQFVQIVVQLFKHQIEGIEFLKTTKRAILADEQGMGKTIQAIEAVKSEEKGAIVVCPASVKFNWRNEINRQYPLDRVIVINSTDPIPPGADWYIINYDILDKRKELLSEFLETGELKTLILDEAHYVKNRSIRARAALNLTREAEKVYLLTGTPIMNRPMELFNLLSAVGSPLAKSWYAYVMRYCNAWRRTLRNGRSFLDTSGASHLDELRGKISTHFLRREKKDALDLPPKIIQQIPIELSKTWREKYDRAFDDYIAFLKTNPIEGKNIDNILLARHLVELQKIKQVCSQAKLEFILHDIEEIIGAGEKVVVFTQYTETLRNIQQGARAKKWSVQTISGETSSIERQRAVEAFQGGFGDIFVGNIKAAGIGITLTAANKVIFADIDWTPAVHDQAEDRCHRIGTTGTVNVYYYIATDTIEEDIMTMLAKKRQIIDAVISGATGQAKMNVAEELIRKISARDVHNSE